MFLFNCFFISPYLIDGNFESGVDTVVSDEKKKMFSLV